MDRLKLITILLIIYLILAISLVARANPCNKKVKCDSHCLKVKSPELVLLELSEKLKREAARSYLRLDWNGTSVTAEQYDKMIETNKDHYSEDPNLRMVNP